MDAAGSVVGRSNERQHTLCQVSHQPRPRPVTPCTRCCWVGFVMFLSLIPGMDRTTVAIVTGGSIYAVQYPGFSRRGLRRQLSTLLHASTEWL